MHHFTSTALWILGAFITQLAEQASSPSSDQEDFSLWGSGWEQIINVKYNKW
jgi:hypothetical protein